jgi:RpiB/LacA/LacB family sugar-phosphate isomerase
MTKIFIGSDHAGFELKQAILQELGIELDIHDCGTNSTERTDYPVFAKAVCNQLLKTANAIGILICSTGIGMSIAANRHSSIRAALCRNLKDAKLSRHHNNANVLVLGASSTPADTAFNMVDTFLNTPFDGGRHEQRICQLDQ